MEWEQLVDSFEDYHLQRLRLNPDGYTSLEGCDNIEAPEVLLSLFLGLKDFYKTLYSNLSQEYQVTLCPYDWRRSINGERYDSNYLYDLPRRVDQCVLQAQGGNPAQQVDIVAHSMGGLVARQYVLSSTERAQKVHTIISLGTPYWGTPTVFSTLRYGTTQNTFLDLATDDDRIKEIAINAPSVYQILPSQKFFESEVLGYLSILYLNGDLRTFSTPTEMNTFLKSTYNGYLVDQAVFLHSAKMDDWRYDGLNVNYFVFLGTNLATPRWYFEQEKKDWGGEISFVPTVLDQPGGGDGTVIERSASLQDSYINYAGDATICEFPNVDHGGLPKDDGVWNEINKALKGLPLSCTTTVQSISSVMSVDITSEAAESRELIVYGKAHVHIWDEQNRHTGPTDDGYIETNIPLTFYRVLENASFISLPPTSIYTIRVEGKDVNPVDLKLLTLQQADSIEETIQQTIIFQQLPAYTGTVATMAYNPWGDPQSQLLFLDIDGDGNPEEEITPDVLDATMSFDLIPPTSTITVEDGDVPGTVTIALSALDDSSGVDRIEYSLDGGLTGQVYSQPIIVNPEEVPIIYVRAIDKAGNTEYPWKSRILSPISLFLPIITR